MKPSSDSNIKWVNSSLLKNAGFQSCWISKIFDLSAASVYVSIIKQNQIFKGEKIFNPPLWFFKKAIVDLRTVDLSILRLELDIRALRSFTNELNWSRRFFSLRLRDFLQRKLWIKWKSIKCISESYSQMIFISNPQVRSVFCACDPRVTGPWRHCLAMISHICPYAITPGMPRGRAFASLCISFARVHSPSCPAIDISLSRTGWWLWDCVLLSARSIKNIWYVSSIWDLQILFRVNCWKRNLLGE